MADLGSHERAGHGARPDERQFSGMRYELENGAYFGSCDWGLCSRDQVGWAWDGQDDDWMAICAPCAAGEFQDPEPHPVVGFITFDDVIPGASEVCT